MIRPVVRHRPRRWARAAASSVGASLLAVAAATATSATSPIEPAEPFPGARLVFADEFDGTTLDTDRWNTCHWWDDEGCTIVTNDELEWYLPEQVTLADGLLHLTVEPGTVEASNGNTYHYVSGMVSTGPPVYLDPAKFAFTYGTVETRINAPAGVGHWAAVWLLAASSYHLPEIDLIEILGEDPAEMIMSFHPSEDEGERQQDRQRLSDEEFGDGWLDLRLDWYPGQLVWYVNGVELFRYEGADVPDEPMYVILNLAEGGIMPGAPTSETTFPASFLVDYVRVWQG